MLTSELIQRLQEHLEENGDLPIYHSIRSRADVEIDDVYFLTNKLCLSNQHLDNYTLTTSTKRQELEEKIKRYADKENITCHDCRWYNERIMNESKLLKTCLRSRDLKIINQNEEFGRDKLFHCFTSKNKELDKLLYYWSILINEEEKEKEWRMKKDG